MNYDTLYKHSAAGLYYVYAYLDPRNPGRYDCITSTMFYEPFYIGKGTRNRYRIHMSFKKQRHPLYNKINKIKTTTGQDPYTVIISTFESEDEAYEFERILIEHLTTMSTKLTNVKPGGVDKGLKYNQVTSRRHPSKFKGVPRSENVKQKISAAKKQHNPNTKRWLVVSPDGQKYTPPSLAQLIVDQLGYTQHGYKVLINVHLQGRHRVERGQMTGWQIYELK